MKTVSNILLYLSIVGIVLTAMVRIFGEWSWTLALISISLIFGSALLEIWDDKREEERTKRRNEYGYTSKKS